MIPAYADSSFLMSVTVEDGNTAEARRYLVRHPAELPFTPLHRLELRNGLRLRVWREEISEAGLTAAFRQIDEDLADGVLLHQPMPWTEALRTAEQLSGAHATSVGSRSADTLHVAVAILAGAKLFLSFDKRQRQLAEAVGLTVKP